MTAHEVAQIFLVPSTVLVGALGVAKTEGLKTGVSTLGILAGGLWLWANGGATTVTPPLQLLPALFVVVWVVSLCVHGPKFRRECCSKRRMLTLERDLAKALPEDDVLIDALRALYVQRTVADQADISDSSNSPKSGNQ